MTDRMEAGSLRAILLCASLCTSGIRVTRGGNRKIEHRRTRTLRYTSAEHSLSDARPFPVATKVNVCSPASNRLVTSFGTTPSRGWWGLALDSTGRFAPFVPGTQVHERNSPPTPSEQPRWKRSETLERRAGSGRYAGRGDGEGFSPKNHRDSILHFSSKT